MALRTSSASEVARLITQLQSTSDVLREAAVARLRILGARAVDRVVALLSSPSPPARSAALRVLESAADDRAFGPVLMRLDDTEPTVALAAVAVVRAHLRPASRDLSVAALDALTAVALDRARPVDVRRASIEALRELCGRTLAPLLAALGEDPEPEIRGLAASTPPAVGQDPGDELRAAAQEDRWPADPDRLKSALAAVGPTLAPTMLGRLVEALRERERRERDDARRMGWTAVRAAVHQTLAARGSRIALYDLRESLEAAVRPLPIGFLAAIGTVGDASCLDALAAAYARSGGPHDDWWREHLQTTFRGVMRRERLTRRHAAIRRVTKRWPDAASRLLSPPRRSRPRRHGIISRAQV